MRSWVRGKVIKPEPNEPGTLVSEAHRWSNYSTTLVTKMPRTNKWLNACNYFNSVQGLQTGLYLSIDDIIYRVMRISKGKVWIAMLKEDE